MCYFFIVIKLLMLKILLAGLLTTASSYDHGYHPSAEEFDNLLSETSRTWTLSFLKAERDRLFVKPAKHLHNAAEKRAKTEAEYFVPKFQYKNNEPKKFNQLGQNPLTNQDLQVASSQKHDKPLQNIGSFVEFNYFSHELPKPMSTIVLNTQETSVRQPTTIKSINDIKQIGSALPAINLKPSARPDALNSNKYSLNKLHANNAQAHFPIYFTNPATGIVYAITEVGKSTQTIAKTNGSIPIFISKEQYERDILQLKNEYKQNCQNLQTTTRPKIIRVRKPPSSLLHITSSQLSPDSTNPAPIKAPPPIVVKTELIVKDKKPSAATRPLRIKKKKTKQKRKIKKRNPPGHRTLSTTVKPLLANQPQGPSIIMGSRSKTENPYENNEKLSTQLEKPNFDVFSSAAVPPKSSLSAPVLKPNLFINNHRVNKRSLQKESKNINTHLKAENQQENYFKSEFVLVNNLTNSLIKSFVSETLNNFLKNSSKIQTKKYVQNSPDVVANESFKQDLFAIKNLQNFAIKNKTFLLTKENIRNKLTGNKEHTFKTTVAALTNAIHVKSNLKHPDKNNFGTFNTEKLSNTLDNLTLTTNASNNNLTKDLTISNLTTANNTNSFISDLKSLSHKELFDSENVPSNSNSAIQSNNKFQNAFENIKNSINRSFFVKLKHHVHKRSTEDFPKFIRNSNKIQNSTTNQGGQGEEFKINKRSFETPNTTKVHARHAINSTENINNRTNNLMSGANKRKTLKYLKKQKRISKMKLNKKLPINTTTTPRLRSNQDHKYKKIKNKSEREQDTEYYFFDMEDDDEDEDEEYEDDDDDEEVEEEEEEEKYKDPNDIFAYDDEPYQTLTSEAGLSAEDLSEKPATVSSSSPEILVEAPNSTFKIEEINLKNPTLEKDDKLGLKPKPTSIKKRIRRRPPQLKIDKDYEDDDEGNSMSSNLAEFFRMIFYPIQVVMSSVMDSFSGNDSEDKNDESNFNPYTQYTSYHNKLKQQSTEEYDEDYDSNESGDSSLSNWFRSWFAFNRRTKKIGSTTAAPNKTKPTKPSSWLPSWLGFNANDRISTETASNEDYDEYDKWFASWFGEIKPKATRRTTATTATTTQIPHVPILTIVDPMKNPQNWIGILAHHIINHTSTSTSNPLKDIWNKVTTTTTENPEVPRKISYDKYQIWRLKPQDESQVKALEEYRKSEDGIKLQWLKGPSLRGLTDVLVPPKMLVDFQASLTFELVDHEVLIFDVGKAIAYEKSKEDYFFTITQKPKKRPSNSPAPIKGMTWHKYYEYDDIIKYLETMRMRFPHLVELIHIGRSYEGRPLIVMKIESKEAAAVYSAHYPAHQRNKLRHKKRIGVANAVFIEAGTHGLEWIGPATATWIINELLRIMKKNVTDDQSFIRNTTWYIMPVLNPDGYVYSHEFDRFWKKSRSRHISRPSGILNSAMTWLQKKRAKEKLCFGVDLNRNWHYQWGRRGSSKSACNEFYAGPTPFSEPETKALSDFLMDYRTQLKLFVSMQSYGQIISYPYKANTTYDSERLDDLLDVAMVGTDGLRKKGSKSRYKIDSSNDLIENRSGCSDAFAAYEVGIPFSYTFQLADNGVHGYLLPSASIESTAKDSFEIITGMLDYI